MRADDDDGPGPQSSPSRPGPAAAGAGAAHASLSQSQPEPRRLPNLDEVFLDEGDAEPGEEETRSVTAVDALGQHPAKAKSPRASAELEPALPSSTRLSVPAGGPVSVRTAVSAPPMSVRPLRAPSAAPPPFAGTVPVVPAARSDLLEATEGEESVRSEALGLTRQAHLALDSDPGPLYGEEPPDAEEYGAIEDVEPESDPDSLPEAGPAPAQRTPFSPSENQTFDAVPDGDPSLNAMLRSSRPAATRTASAPPPPPSLATRLGGPSPSYRPPPPPSLRPPALDSHQAPKTLVSAPPTAPTATPLPQVQQPYLPEVVPQRSSRGGWLLSVGLLMVPALVAGFWFMQRLQPGSLVVTLVGPGSQPLHGIRLFVDSKLVCQASPCRVPELAEGTHLVRAEADGYASTAEQAVIVNAGKEAAHNLVLERAATETRLSITTSSAGFRVAIDGKDYGTSPVELTDLAAGEHLVEVSREGFESVRETVTIAPGERHTLGPFNPKLLQGRLTLTAGDNAADAEVRLDDKLIQLPFDQPLSADALHSISASKAGFAPFQRSIGFSSSEPHVNIELTLAALGSAPVDSGVPLGARPPSSGSSENTSAAAEATNTAPPKTGQGTLNINSLPASTVVLDGRPLGETPRIGVSVSPGRHTVVFVHPERGRKSVQVEIDAGATHTVSVRF